MRLCLALLFLLIATPVASAATVTMRDEVERDGGRTYVYGVIAVTAAPGEANALSVDYGGDAVVVRDAAATLTGDGRCVAVDAHTVRCDGSGLDGITELEADLGDLADTARVLDGERLPYVVVRGGDGDDEIHGGWATLEGGPGNDVLRGDRGREVLHGGDGADTVEGLGDGDYVDGGAGDDALSGGDGHDVLLGGGGSDALDGGAGNDSLSDQDGRFGPVGADRLTGGAGDDAVQSYLLRREPVHVDLTRQEGQGQSGENDTLTGVEDVYGGAGDDTLIGDAGPNRLDGDRGRDVIRGGGGNDVLVSDVNPREHRQNAHASAYGPDRVYGDGGDDVVETLATVQSTIACGGGRDRVDMHSSSADRAPSSLGPLVSGSCERLSMGGFTIDPYPAFGRGAVTFTAFAFRCCRQRLELQTVQSRPRQVGAAPVRRRTVRVGVRRPPRTMRGKVTNVARNRFVWRFRRGF